MKKTFTIVEILITIGIIGVVAALTISPLVKHYREKAIVTKVEKTYAMLEQAFSMAINEYGAIDSWCNISQNYPECSEKMRSIISKYLKVSTICTGWGSMDECMAGSGVKYASAQGEKDKTPIYNTYLKSMRLTDGMGITFDARNYGNDKNTWCKTDKNTRSYSYSCGFIYVDINGTSGPNRDGVDLFAFVIKQNGLVPHGRSGLSAVNPAFEHNCIKPMLDIDQGKGSCTAWVLSNKNMDYLHCPEKLGWEVTKKKSCKD